MKQILLFGAGKSATTLIKYLGNECALHQWKLLVCDANEALVNQKINGLPAAESCVVNVFNDAERAQFIRNADLVISLLPPSLHFLVAQDCLQFHKHLLTASYVDENTESLRDEVMQNGLLFLYEMGLDPGIDHMSAKYLIDGIKEKGGSIYSFKSHCGGLISPESDDNSWHYKITWNPANVVSAGKAGATYRENNEIISIDYESIFSNCKQIKVPSLPDLAWYANRDSLSYMKTYQLESCSTFIRTTLRYPSFCRGWNKIVALDLTNADDVNKIADCVTWSDWFQLKKHSFQNRNSISEATFFDEEFKNQLEFLNIDAQEKLPKTSVSSAELLQFLLEKKWVIQPHDKDMIVMMHEIGYELNGTQHEIKSSLVVKGENSIDTAMSKTVGLPLGIAAKLILQQKIQLTGLHIPVLPEIYKPVLEELANYGVQFLEENTKAGI